MSLGGGRVGGTSENGVGGGDDGRGGGGDGRGDGDGVSDGGGNGGGGQTPHVRGQAVNRCAMACCVDAQAP